MAVRARKLQLGLGDLFVDILIASIALALLLCLQWMDIPESQLLGYKLILLSVLAVAMILGRTCSRRVTGCVGTLLGAAFGLYATVGFPIGQDVDVGLARAALLFLFLLHVGVVGAFFVTIHIIQNLGKKTTRQSGRSAW